MPPLLDLSGQRYGRLTVVQPTDRRSTGSVIFECRCDCGRTSFASGGNLRGGKVRSCGCSKVESLYRHGLSRHPSYHAWHSLVARCTDRDHPQWADYGGRGIRVCDEWSGEFGIVQFVADMGVKPQGTSLDRIDNDGPYSKDNCRWATVHQQQSNTRSNVNITFQGKTQILSEWARELGIAPDTLAWRLKSGRPLDKILTSTKPIPRASKR